MKNYSPILTRTGGLRAMIPFRQTPVALAALAVLATDQSELSAMMYMAASGPVQSKLKQLPPPPPGHYSAHWLQYGMINLMPQAAHMVAIRQQDGDSFCAAALFFKQFHHLIAIGAWNPKVNPYLVWSGAIRGLFPDVSTDVQYLARLGEWEIHEMVYQGGEAKAKELAEQIYAGFKSVRRNAMDYRNATGTSSPADTEQ